MTRKNLFLSLIGFSMITLFTSCNDNDDTPDLMRPTAVVTVCPNDDGSFVMQLDNETQLIPTNMKSSPFGEKEVRALVNFSDSPDAQFEKGSKNVVVNWLDSIRTKLPVENLGDQNDTAYGNDPIEIVRDWVTVAEDGYLTLRIRTLWSSGTYTHTLNLVTGTNPDDPYELELRHDADGDTDGRWGDALIAFNLNRLPRTDSDTVNITLKWKSFMGEKSTQFEMKLRPQN